jgi:hypothetical protein
MQPGNLSVEQDSAPLELLDVADQGGALDQEPLDFGRGFGCHVESPEATIST